MARFTLRRSMLSSPAMARWLWPAPCQSWIVCSRSGAFGSAGGTTAPTAQPGCRAKALDPRSTAGVFPVLIRVIISSNERTSQRQGGPGADQGADRAVAQAVRQVGADRGRDPGTQAPARQRSQPSGPRLASRLALELRQTPRWPNLLGVCSLVPVDQAASPTSCYHSDHGHSQGMGAYEEDLRRCSPGNRGSTRPRAPGRNAPR